MAVTEAGRGFSGTQECVYPAGWACMSGGSGPLAQEARARSLLYQIPSYHDRESGRNKAVLKGQLEDLPPSEFLPCFLGPLHTTASLGFSSRKPTDMREMLCS